jgi:hypothetical protein
MTNVPHVHTLTDRDLIDQVKRLTCSEREATARLIASLIEFDTRRLYLQEGCSSLFTYCTQVLRLSEHAAYGRIEAARTARKFPVVLEQLMRGDVTLTNVGLLARHLTPENYAAVLAEARHKSKREVEQIVARLQPQPDAPTVIRQLPAPRAAMPQPPNPDAVGAALGATLPEPLAQNHSEPSIPHAAPAIASQKPALIQPTAPERFKVQLTVSRETYDKLRRAQDLLRHTIPNGDPAVVFDRALSALVRDLEREKVAAVERPRRAHQPRPGRRGIPAAVRRAVWRRDGSRYAFVGTAGRCTETGFLEFHHVVPFAAGGESTSGARTSFVRCLQISCVL